MKLGIYEFDPKIYPRLIWVVKGGTIDCLNKIFHLDHLLKEEEEEDFLAMTIPCTKREGKLNGAILWFPSAKGINDGKVVAHESVHAATYIYKTIGGNIEMENHEPYAYLVGYIYDCVDKVRRIKHGKVSESADYKVIQLEEAGEEENLHRNG
jgi:hypothetical protein